MYSSTFLTVHIEGVPASILPVLSRIITLHETPALDTWLGPGWTRGAAPAKQMITRAARETKQNKQYLSDLGIPNFLQAQVGHCMAPGTVPVFECDESPHGVRGMTTIGVNIASRA